MEPENGKTPFELFLRYLPLQQFSNLKFQKKILSTTRRVMLAIGIRETAQLYGIVSLTHEAWL